VRFDNRVLDDFIIMKRDYTPVYNFAVVADDHDMAMTHVIRGEEHLSNTPKQLLVYQALGFQPPQFAHLPMILAPDRSKLSKRHGATSVEEYRDQGILPEALANYLLLLGWSDPNGREFLTLDEAARLFTLDRVQHTAAIYDQKKLEWMNHQYLMQLPLERVVEAVRPFITYALDNGPPLSDAVALSRERSATLVQLAESMRFLYEAPRTFEAKAVAKQFTAGVDELLEAIRDRLLTVTPWDHDHLMNAYDQLAEARQVKRAVLIHPTRLAVTGRSVGPGLFELLTLLGRDETVKRLQFAADALRTGTLATD
ncbi:MAG: glutamate--tRNA ligase, partial [Sulfobacillus sp.]|nr:glutamate--tRNA ligase [Sulfobacillus sp.]